MLDGFVFLQGSHKFSKQTEDILSSETEDTSQGYVSRVFYNFFSPHNV